MRVRVTCVTELRTLDRLAKVCRALKDQLPAAYLYVEVSLLRLKAVGKVSYVVPCAQSGGLPGWYDKLDKACPSCA